MAGDAGEDALARMREAGDALTAGVADRIPAWAVAQVQRILDAWGRADGPTRERAMRDAPGAGAHAASRVAGELRALLERDPADQAATPLQVVRSAYREPTAVLLAAGVPPVERDAFDERSWPDDRYGLVPRTLADLRSDERADDDLGPLLLVWGMTKAAVLRARRDEAESGEPPGSRR